MKPEEEARKDIDGLLEQAGWVIQDMNELNLGASLGVIVREYQLPTGPVDYLIFVDRVPVGTIEAKPKGTTLSGVSGQSQRYIEGIKQLFSGVGKPPVFVYESTGSETLFRDLRDPFSRSRRVFAFHRPETLQEWFCQEDTLRTRLRELPPLITTGLRECQKEAILNLEGSFHEARPRALIQMATGSGKTFMAVSSVYRLIKYANAKRVLFLVDRNNLGKQTRREFDNYITPDDGRKFSELYNIQHLQSNTLDPVCRVCITTIQRLYSMLKGESDADFNPESEEESLFDGSWGGEERPVEYNPCIPIEEFDFIITDECHRSIYNLWRQVLEYFDAFIVGLTATPSKQTLGFFHQNLVMEYNHDRAIADGVNVGYEVYRIRTRIGDEGSTVDAGFYVDTRDKLTRQVRWQLLDEELEYGATELDRSVVSKNQIRTVIRAFRNALFSELFPGRSETPKTLVFCKNDSHAEDVVEIIREEFGRGNLFCQKITYKTSEKPENLIASFRNSYYPRIAVTVDMVSTGTDIKPIECILFLRDVKSRVYFEQMKGRGTRTISVTDLNGVTPDAKYKTHFVIVDAVGVCENDKTDSRPLERKRGVSFEKLLKLVASGIRDEDALSSLADRLSRLERKLDGDQKKELEAACGGLSLREITNGLLDAIDPDKKLERSLELFYTDSPSEEQLKEISKELMDGACRPFDNPCFRERLLEVKKSSDQIIDTISVDEVTFQGFNGQATEQAETVVRSFKEFIRTHKDEIDALQIIYEQPFARRHLTFEQIKELADAIRKPPFNLSTELVWKAYEKLEKSRVRGAGPQKLLTDIISLVRFATEHTNMLEPFPEVVDRKFEEWLEKQQASGTEFSSEQMEWLVMIKNHIASSVSIEKEDFESTPFYQKGGLVKFFKLFGTKIDEILDQLNEVLVSD